MPRARAMSRNSATSSRRSPRSNFETKDCGRPSFFARATCVNPASWRAWTSSFRNCACFRLKADFVTPAVCYPELEYPKMGYTGDRVALRRNHNADERSRRRRLLWPCVSEIRDLAYRQAPRRAPLLECRGAKAPPGGGVQDRLRTILNMCCGFLPSLRSPPSRCLWAQIGSAARTGALTEATNWTHRSRFHTARPTHVSCACSASKPRRCSCPSSRSQAYPPYRRQALRGCPLELRSRSIILLGTRNLDVLFLDNR